MAEYKFDEWLEAMRPQYEKMQADIKQSIEGLTKHAAVLAAQGQEEQTRSLRNLVEFMSLLWFSGDLKVGDPDPTAAYLAEYDSAIETAKLSGEAAPLSDDEKVAVIKGVLLQHKNMEEDFDDISRSDYLNLANQLGDEWKDCVALVRDGELIGAAPREEQGQEGGGMTLG